MGAETGRTPTRRVMPEIIESRFVAVPKMTCTRLTVVTIKIVTTQGGVCVLSLHSDQARTMTIR